MSENTTPIATLIERAENYSNSTLELIKLQVVDKSADVISSLLSRLAIIITTAIAVLIINIGFALWIGKALGNTYYGFFIIGGFYALITILLHYFRHQWLKYPISNSIIRQMQKQKNYE